MSNVSQHVATHARTSRVHCQEACSRKSRQMSGPGPEKVESILMESRETGQEQSRKCLRFAHPAEAIGGLGKVSY